MANVWQANYWAGGSKTYGSSHEGYDSSTGYCNLASLGQMIAGRYSSKDNVTCLRFACNDNNYSKVHFMINNATDYTGQGTVKILVRTSALSSVTKSALENLGTVTREYTCVNSSSGYGELNEFDLEYNFKKGTVYYIYIWGKDSDTWRFRWYAPDETFSGFAVTYTEVYTFSITGDAGVASVTGSGEYAKGESVTTTATAKTGYHLVSYTGQAADGTGSNTWTGCAGSSTHTTTWAINANRTIKVNSALNTYKLTYTNTTGATISVKKSGTSLSSGSTITHGDVLTISVSANAGYNVNSITVNGSTFTSGNTHTVSGNVTIVVTVKLKTYKLSISQGVGTSITVNRTSSPLGSASTGVLSNSATIYYNDVLNITTEALSGYRLVQQSHNNGSYTVTDAINVSATAELLGLVYIHNGTSWVAYEIYIDNGSKWDRYIPHIDNGSEWNICI